MLSTGAAFMSERCPPRICANANSSVVGYAICDKKDAAVAAVIAFPASDVAPLPVFGAPVVDSVGPPGTRGPGVVPPGGAPMPSFCIARENIWPYLVSLPAPLLYSDSAKG